LEGYHTRELDSYVQWRVLFSIIIGMDFDTITQCWCLVHNWSQQVLKSPARPSPYRNRFRWWRWWWWL